jgi:hypothetical protein
MAHVLAPECVTPPQQQSMLSATAKTVVSLSTIQVNAIMWGGRYGLMALQDTGTTLKVSRGQTGPDQLGDVGSRGHQKTLCLDARSSFAIPSKHDASVPPIVIVALDHGAVPPGRRCDGQRTG